MSRFFAVSKFIIILSMIFISCDPNQETPEKNEITGHPVLSREEVISAYETIYLGTTVDDPQWTGDIETCDPGTVPESVSNKVLARINFYRVMCGLPGDIVFVDEKNQKCQYAALMFHKNSNLSHDPPTNWECWTAMGHEAAQSSNIGLGSANTPVHTSNAIDYYIEDDATSNESLGHRRWILYSKAKYMGHGSTTRANAIWVAGNENNPVPDDLPQFIAYPPPGFIPYPLCYRKWSFSVPEANFEAASVVMTDQYGNETDLTVTYKTNIGDPIIGDNSIVWFPDISLSASEDNTFTVTIDNVELFGELFSYTYEVTVIPVEE